MSRHTCEHCGAIIVKSPRGYVTGCKHYPLSDSGANGAWGNTYHHHLRKGVDHGYAAHLADEYCERYKRDSARDK